MLSFQQKFTWHAKRQGKKKLFEKTKQVSEPEADMAWMLELSVK